MGESEDQITTSFDSYSAQKLKDHLIEWSVVNTGSFRVCLDETLSKLDKEDLKKLAEERIKFYELDRWGQYLVLPGKAICISQETVGLGPKRAKFIFLHEIGHILSNHQISMSNRALEKTQEDEAEDFAKKHFPEWEKHFYRDENSDLKLVEECGKNDRERR